MKSNIPAVILAGGKSIRFSGANKAFLTFGKKRIVDLMLDVLKDIFPKVMIITNKPSDFSEFKDVLVIKDIMKNCGPLGGIYTGLKNINTRSAFFIACDMPCVNKKIIEKILKISQKEKGISTVPFTGKGFEPLFAVYNREIMSGLKKAIKKKEFSIIKTVKKFPHRGVKLNKKEIRLLANINTRSDFRNALYEFRNFKNY